MTVHLPPSPSDLRLSSASVTCSLVFRDARLGADCPCVVYHFTPPEQPHNAPVHSVLDQTPSRTLFLPTTASQTPLFRSLMEEFSHNPAPAKVTPGEWRRTCGYRKDIEDFHTRHQRAHDQERVENEQALKNELERGPILIESIEEWEMLVVHCERIGKPWDGRLRNYPGHIMDNWGLDYLTDSDEDDDEDCHLRRTG